MILSHSNWTQNPILGPLSIEDLKKAFNLVQAQTSSMIFTTLQSVYLT